MGSEGMPLYISQLVLKVLVAFQMNMNSLNEQTYEISKTQAIPISIPAIDADYANLTTIDEN
jgi:hypothetical protein